MISSVTLGSVTLSCDFVNKPQLTRIVEHQIPGRNGSVLQDLGNQSVRVELKGKLEGVDMETDKSTLEGYRGTNQTYTDSDESFTMTVAFVDIPTVGGVPNHYLFTIRGYKYEQT